MAKSHWTSPPATRPHPDRALIAFSSTVQFQSDSSTCNVVVLVHPLLQTSQQPVRAAQTTTLAPAPAQCCVSAAERTPPAVARTITTTVAARPHALSRPSCSSAAVAGRARAKAQQRRVCVCVPSLTPQNASCKPRLTRPTQTHTLLCRRPTRPRAAPTGSGFTRRRGWARTRRARGVPGAPTPLWS